MEIAGIIKKDYVVLDDQATISEMIGQLKKFEKRTGLVFHHKKYKGLVEKRALLRSRLNSNEAKIEHFVHMTPIVNKHADVIETAALMFQSNLDFLPVESENEIIGVLQGTDVAHLAVNLPVAAGWKLNDCKLVKPKMVKVGDPLAKVLKIMHEDKIDQVPIFDNGGLFGIITYRDILRRYLNWSPKRDHSVKFNAEAKTKSAEVDMPNLAMLPVETFSTNDNLTTVQINKSVKEAMHSMLEAGLSCLPIFDGEKFVGMLPVKSVLRKVASLKIPENFNIQFVGLNDLNLEADQKVSLQKICSNEAFKLQRAIKKDFTLHLHFKVYEKEGNQQKYSINLRIDFPGQVIATSEDDWDLHTALRKVFNNAKNSVK